MGVSGMRLLKRYSLLLPVLVGVVAVALVIVIPSAAFGEDDSSAFGATLSSFQETPTLSTDGHGTLRLTLNADNIQYTLTFSDLSSDVHFAHLHLGARALAGGVFAFLCGGGGKPACVSPVSGTIKTTDIL